VSGIGDGMERGEGEGEGTAMPDEMGRETGLDNGATFDGLLRLPLVYGPLFWTWSCLRPLSPPLCSTPAPLLLSTLSLTPGQSNNPSPSARATLTTRRQHDSRT
jgi:hypothetical protein